jgi:GMP synthase (glutamine-hydrolysing)
MDSAPNGLPRHGFRDIVSVMSDVLRVLLVQSRTDKMRAHEHQCFAGRTGGQRVRWQIASLFDPEMGPDLLLDCDAVIVAGSGEVDFQDPRLVAVLPMIRAFVRAAAERNVPFLGVSFGHQLAAHAFDGPVVADPTLSELGTATIRLTDEGKADPLFAGVPDSFPAIQGHNDSVGAQPADFRLLAGGDCCPVQAMRLPDTLFYTLQFHPELDEHDLRVRIRHYRQQYERTPGRTDEALASLGPTPDANHIVETFIALSDEARNSSGE